MDQHETAARYVGVSCMSEAVYEVMHARPYLCANLTQLFLGDEDVYLALVMEILSPSRRPVHCEDLAVHFSSSTLSNGEKLLYEGRRVDSGVVWYPRVAFPPRYFYRTCMYD